MIFPFLCFFFILQALKNIIKLFAFKEFIALLIFLFLQPLSSVSSTAWLNARLEGLQPDGVKQSCLITHTLEVKVKSHLHPMDCYNADNSPLRHASCFCSGFICILRWPRELNALQLQKTNANGENTSKSRKQLHQFDSRCCKCSQKKKKKICSVLFFFWLWAFGACVLYNWQSCFLNLQVFFLCAVHWALSATVAFIPVSDPFAICF